MRDKEGRKKQCPKGVETMDLPYTLTCTGIGEERGDDG